MASLTWAPPQAATPLRPRDGARLVVQTWLFTRLLVVGVLLWVGITTGRSATDMLANWDVQHYLRIARDGYAAPNDIAFFPGLPLVLRLFALVGVPGLVAGILIAVTCSALAAAALFRLGGPVAAIVWLLAPTTVFTLVPYTEAPFCAAAFWAWERARSGRWGQAAVLASLACTLRVSGLFLVCALLVLAVFPGRSREAVGGDVRVPRYDPRGSVPSYHPRGSGLARVPVFGGLLARLSSIRGPLPGGLVAPAPVAAGERWRRSRLRPVVCLLLPAATLFGYAVYLRVLTGDWNAWYTAQTTGWPRGFTLPWVSAQHTWEAANSTAYPAFPEWSWVFRAELISMGIGLIVTIACLVLRRWGEASWVGVQVLAFSCSYWFLSVNRAVLLWFPLFILLGEALGRPRARRRRVLLVALGFLAAAVVLGFWTWLFATGRWAS